MDIKLVEINKYLLVGAIVTFFAIPITYAKDSGVTKASISVVPVSVTNVKGDADKYRSHHWRPDGSNAGIKDAKVSYASSQLNVNFEGSSFPEANDNSALLDIFKEDLGYINTSYKSFRKYYDGTGGVYNLFSVYGVNQSNQDLELDLSQFKLETGIKKDGVPELGIAYERDTKDGRKSRLTWTTVKDGNTSRNIGPVWQDLDEVTDAVSLIGKTDVAGITLSGEQRFEFVHVDSLREEKLISNSGTASDTKMRRQWQTPETDMMTTTLRGEKWMLDDKNYVSMGYRYTKLDNSENETLSEYDANGTPASYSSPKNKPNASANNDLNLHTWTGMYVSKLMPVLNFISKFKAEVVKRHGTSTYPSDTTNPPDNIMNTVEVSNVENKVYRTGQNFSLRYSGLPKTSLYAELELEQARNWITEERDSIAGQSSADAAEQINRETITHGQKTIATVGGKVNPIKQVTVTSQYRHRIENSDYDDVFESVYSSGAKSAFIDALKTNKDEFSNRIGWKPLKWVDTGVRYQLGSSVYLPRAENQLEMKSRMINHTFTYDLSVQPIDNMILTGSYARQLSKMSTPAATISSGKTPGLTSNVDSWILAASYAPLEKLSMSSSFSYSHARNFDDYAGYSLGNPMGASFDLYDLTMGVDWIPKKDWHVKPNYYFSQYAGDYRFDVDGYTSHAIMLEFTYDWM